MITAASFSLDAREVTQRLSWSMPYRPTTAPEILVGGERRPAARRPLSAAAAPRPPAPRAQDTRHGVKSGGNAFIGTERRFHWQGDMVKTHAMYDLPTQLKSHGARRRAAGGGLSSGQTLSKLVDFEVEELDTGG